MIAFLGWTLVHAVWQGGIIAVIVAVLLWSTRRAGASARYVIALAGLALMVAAPIATTLATERSVGEQTTWTARDVAPTPTVSHAATGFEPGTEATSARPDRSFARQIGERVDTALPWLVAGWLIGVCVLSIRVLVGVRNVLRLGRRGVASVDARIRSIANVMGARLGIRGAVRLLQSTHVDVPMVIGWIRPTVLVPVSMITGIVPAQLEMLLAHELAHIRRHDTIINLAQTVIDTLLFFHPAAWWISARVREERENCCDDLALAVSGNDRAAYGSVLLLLEESRSTSALAAAATDGSLLRRIRRLALGSPSRVDLGTSWFAGVATMLVMMVIVVPTGAPAAARERITALAIIQPATTTSDNPPVESTIQTQEPAFAHPVENPSRSTAMKRPSLVASAAALAIAATSASAQGTPNFSGRWVSVPDSAVIARPNAPVDSAAREFLTIEQTERTLTISNAAGDTKMTFLIEDSVGVRLPSRRPLSRVIVRGPVALDIGIGAGRIALDSRAGTLHVGAQSDKGGIYVTTTVPKEGATEATLTLTLDATGDLIVQTDIPAVDNQPASRTFQRLRRV